MTRNFFIYLLFFGFSCIIIQAQELPVKLKDNQPSLRQLVDPSLQLQLENSLNSNSHWKTLIQQKKMAVGVVDLSNPEDIKFARVNGNNMMYAASLPKIEWALLLTL